MIAIANWFNSYDNLQISSSNEEIYNYAKKEDYSTSLFTFINFTPPVFIPPLTIYDSSEVYLNKEFIGYYYKNQIDESNHKVTYDLSLYDKSVLPENFDFHFEDHGLLTKFVKALTSGIMITTNKKMIIDPK